MVGWLCPGSGGQGLQQSLAAPFADHVVNSPSRAWGKEETAQSIPSPSHSCHKPSALMEHTELRWPSDDI